MEANKLLGFPLVCEEPYAIPNNGLPILAIITSQAEIEVGPVSIDGLVEFLAGWVLRGIPYA
jgi:hypothetical protein